MKIKKEPLNITIIGGGLVGSICACFMAKRGHNVNLYEYRNDIRKIDHIRGRSINLSLSARGRAALRTIGLEDHMVNEHGIPMCARMIHNLNGTTHAIPYDAKTNQCIFSVGRNHLNKSLLSAAEKYDNLKLHFNHKLVNAHLTEGKLTFIQTKNENKTIEILSDFIIGADGAFSAVRRSMMKEPLFDYSQKYIEHGYLELCIPPTENEFAMPANYLHIWPRGEFMMIALPNQDKSWTVTLFMPFSNFKSLDTPKSLLNFFNTHFPDSVPLIGEKRLVKDFFNSTPSTLVSIKCKPYHIDGKTIIIGDAAHAMVPFYGQGMNAGFEDCTILNELMELYNDDLGKVLPEFTRTRSKDAHAICDLAMYNYIEMRHLVNKKSFRLRKKFDDFLFWILPDLWVPLYNSVTFTRMGYQACAENRQWQDQIITRVFMAALILFAILILACFCKFSMSRIDFNYFSKFYL